MPKLSSPEYGKVYRARSDRFGDCDMLCAKIPGSCWYDKTVLLPIRHGSVSEALRPSSVERDEILKEWPNLSAYFAEEMPY